MPNKYRDPRECECGYTTVWMSAWSVHRRTCRGVPAPAVETELRERVQSLEQQLVAKDEQMLAKDRQIEELMRQNKRPRTENSHNISYNVNQNINVFGKESLGHVTEAKLQELIQDPETSVARLVTLKHSAEENRNVRVPNVRDRWVQVLKEDEDGGKRWETVEKGDILGDLVMDTAMDLDREADEDTQVGKRFVQWHEKLKESSDQKGQLYRDQCSRVHRSLAGATRSN